MKSHQMGSELGSATSPGAKVQGSEEGTRAGPEPLLTPLALPPQAGPLLRPSIWAQLRAWVSPSGSAHQGQPGPGAGGVDTQASDHARSHGCPSAQPGCTLLLCLSRRPRSLGPRVPASRGLWVTPWAWGPQVCPTPPWGRWGQFLERGPRLAWGTPAPCSQRGGKPGAAWAVRGRPPLAPGAGGAAQGAGCGQATAEAACRACDCHQGEGTATGLVGLLRPHPPLQSQPHLAGRETGTQVQSPCLAPGIPCPPAGR